MRRARLHTRGPTDPGRDAHALLVPPLSEVVHRLVDRGASAFGDSVPRAKDPRCPYGVALERGCRGKRDQHVQQPELVVELHASCERFTHQRDRLIGVPELHRQDGANVHGRLRNHGPACRSTEVA